MKLTHFRALVKARTMEFVRDRGTFFWNLLFPVLMIIGFAFAIPGNDTTLFKVGTFGNSGSLTAGSSAAAFAAMPQIQFIDYGTATPEAPAKAVEKLRQHQLDLLVDWEKQRYWLNAESPKSLVLERLLVGAGSPAASFAKLTISGKPIRYVDWLVPGVIGMNMMFSCLFGVGYVIVRYRKNGVLKRLKATPVSAISFVAAQTASRFLIVMSTAIVVFTGTNLFLGFRMEGNYLLLLAHTSLAILSLISLGLVFAARLKSEELVNGLMNIITFPMIIFSGVFFSLEGTSEVLQQAARVFPLTHFIEGARNIMIQGAGIVEILPSMLYLAISTILFMIISAFMFKWE